MQLNGYNTFQYIYQAYSDGIASGISSVVSKVLSSAQLPLHAMLVIFVAILGYATLTGRMAYGDGVNRIVRMSFVVLLVSSASIYGEYVVSFFTTGLPDFFAQHIAGAPPGTNPGASFDTIMVKMWLNATAVWEKAPWDFKAIYDGILIVLSLGIVACALVLMFAVFLVVQTLLGVVVAVGPLVILGYLFDYTKKIVDGWIDVLVTLSVVTLGVDIVLELLLKAITTALNDLTLTGSSDNQLQELLGISLVVLVLSAAVVILPRAVERIGSGVGVPMDHARRWLRGEPAARAAKYTGIAGAAAAGSPAARRYIVNRLRSRFGR
jgi:type IV secretion system protein VirB6